MSNFIKYDFQKIRDGDLSQPKKTLDDIKSGNIQSGNLLYAIDALCANESFLQKFTNSFSKEWNSKKYNSNKQEVKFRTLSEQEVEKLGNLKEQELKSYDVTQTSITPTIATTIIPSTERLIRSTEILSRVKIINRNANTFYQFFDFDSEQDGAILSEVAGGSDVDEVLRTGDRVIPNQKIQASMKMSEFVLTSLIPEDLGTYVARLARRVQHRLCVAILANGAGASNGTARGDNIRGILNNYGVSGIGDATNAIGAISYATKSATDSAIVANGGVASTDAYDLCYKASLFLLPSNIQDVEEGEYVFIGNRYAWGAIASVKDSNGRYLAGSAIDPLTGKLVKQINGIEFLEVPQAQVPNNRVYLVPLKFYTLVLHGDLMNLSDNGLVQLREGVVQLVSRTWATGSMEYGQKYRPTTNATIGTTAPDNAEQNAFRVFNLV